MKKRIIFSLFTILLLLTFVGCTKESKKKDFSFEEFGITFESKEVEYDGNAHSIYIAGNLPEGITVTYVGNEQTKVGTHIVVASFTDTTEKYKPIPNLTANLVIKEKTNQTLTGISLNNKTVTYDGSAHSIEITGTLPQGVSVSYTGNGQVNAGTYTVTANFIDTTGIYGTIAPLSATLTINKANYDMSSVVLPGKSVTYNGEVHSLQIEGTLPEGVSVSYENNNQTEAGTYIVVANFTHNNPNYNSIAPLASNLSINKLDFDLSNITFNDVTVTYDGNAHSIEISNEGDLPEFFEVIYENNGQVNAGVYTVTAIFNHDYIEYNPVEPMTATLTINKADYDMSGVTFVDKSVIYSGSAQNIYVQGALPAGLSVNYTGNGQTEIGTYTVVANFTDTTGNYNNPTSLQATLTIKANPFTGVTFDGKTVTYDGNPHSLEISGTLPEGVTVSYVNNNQTNAGTYIVQAVFNDTTGNYSDVPALEATLVINKADYDMSGVSFENKTVTYTQFIQSLAVAGLPAGLKVVYDNNENTNVGTYIVVANFVDTTGNYNNPESMSATLTIEQGEYNMSGITFASKEYSYDGTTKSLAISGTLPTGVTVTYTGNNQTEIGTYTVVANFTHNNPNYKAIAAMSATLTIGNNNVRTVTFVLESGNIEKTVKVNEALTDIPTIPAKVGYTSYWDYDFSSITENVTLEPIYDPIYYSINYELNDSVQNEENINIYTVETSFTFLAPTKEGYTFLGWYKEESLTNKVTQISQGTTGNMTLWASFELDQAQCIVVGANQTYTTITAGLAAATEGSIIYVMPGTYAETVTVSVANVTILGPNAGIAGTATRNSEATINGSVTISANNVTIDGISIGGSGITLNSVSNIVLTNLRCTGYNSDNTFIKAASVVNNFEFTNSYVSINDSAAGIPFSFTTMTGNVNISNNTLIDETDNYFIELGDCSGCTNVYIMNNIIAGYNGGECTSIEIKNFKSTTGTIEFVGNHITNSTGTNLMLYNCTGKANIKYNTYVDSVIRLSTTSYQGTNSTYAYNVFINCTFTGSYECWTNGTYPAGYTYATYTGAQLAQAYAADTYYNVIEDATYTIVYILNEGVGDESQIAVVDTNVTLYTPTREGYHFLGWTLKSSSTDYIDTYKQSGTDNVVLYAQWEELITYTVTFDLNGGTTAGTVTGTEVVTTLVVNNYNNANGGSHFTTERYTNDIFVYSLPHSSTTAKAWTHIYLAKDSTTGQYVVVGVSLPVDPSTGTKPDAPTTAEYVIVYYTGYAGTGTANFDVNKVTEGLVVAFSGDITTATTTNALTVNFSKVTQSTTGTVFEINQNTNLIIPSRTGYIFAGWYDENNVKYTKGSDFTADTTVIARWILDDEIIGSFEEQSWVVAGEQIELSAYYESGANEEILWVSETPNIATVAGGVVTGVSEGVATIKAQSPYSDYFYFTFYVTVFNDEPTGMLKVIADSNNTSIFTRTNLAIGAGTPEYYYDVIGSVSKLLFTPYVEHTDYYLSSPANKTTLTGTGTGGVDFITFHYAADMGTAASAANQAKYALTGGKNLASYNKTCNTNGTGASWNYSTGNDGIWYCQNVAYGAWHAGTSKTMTWASSGVTTSQVGTDVYTTDVTCGSDNYFYIKGVKTTVKNTTGYSYTKMNDMGLGVKLVGTTWYLGGHYYNSSYGYICSLGGNLNSIGIESSVRVLSDLWLTWQYSAQLCAKLLLQFNLPLNRLVGHHFFSGKDCPQPLLENDLEIWYEFVELTRQQMALYETGTTSASVSLASNSSYINNLGRVTSLPSNVECVTYTVTYVEGSTTKTVTLSTILPNSL